MDILEYNEQQTFTVITENGEEMTCNILVAFESEDTEKYYIVYTDNTVDEEGNLQVYASVCDPTADEPTLLPLETDEEWELVEAALDDYYDREA